MDSTPSPQPPRADVASPTSNGDAPGASPKLPARVKRGAASLTVAAGARSSNGASGGSSGTSSSGAGKAMPCLPARAGSSSAGGSTGNGVIDPNEPPATQALRASVHAIRVRLIRAARRLGYEHDNGLVKQVLYRLYLAEKLKEPFRKGTRRPDAALLAARDASRLEADQGPGSPLGFNVKILVIGLRGTGKTQLIRSLLDCDPTAASAAGSSSSSSGGSSGGGGGGAAAASNDSSGGGAPDAFAGGTRRVQVHSGRVLGIQLTLIDTPGLTASAAGTAANAGVLRGIKAAFKAHSPDLVLYVDRFDQPTRAGGELPVLQAVTSAIGPHIWLNTIVALTHAGSMPPGSSQGQMSWDGYSQQRSQLLQLIIRSASGDARLMNPIAFAESHPLCKRNSQGQAVIPSGLGWQQHMLVLIVSAKLLADAEAALQMSPDASGGGTPKLGAGGLDAAAMRQLVGRPEGPPVRYLMAQLTGCSQPLPFPDHSSVMELRAARQRLRGVRAWRARKELHRQIRFRLLQAQQAQRRQARTSDLLCKATRAGGKLQLAQPRTATRCRPSVQPPVGHRYRALEPASGWIVRPHIEPHGMDNADNVDGFLAEKAGVARHMGRDELLAGAPYRLSSSASASKEQLLLQARGELSVYHDLPGLASTSVSGDLQTSGAPGTSPDMLLVLRLDSQRRGFPVAANNPAVGVMLARLAQEGRPHRGPLAAGLRVQNCVRLAAPGGAPVELDMALGRMFCRPGVEPDDAWGGSAEARTDARRLLGSRFAAPLSLSGSMLSHRGETMAAVSAGLQVQRGRRAGIGGKLQVNNRGSATLGLQVRSDGSQWWSLVGLVPLVNLAWGAAAARRLGAQAASGLGTSAGGAAEAVQRQAGSSSELPGCRAP